MKKTRDHKKKHSRVTHIEKHRHHKKQPQIKTNDIGCPPTPCKCVCTNFGLNLPPNFVPGLVSYSVNEEVKAAIIKIQNPPLNTINRLVIQSLYFYLLQAEKDVNIRSVIITGTGDAFSAGRLDLSEFVQAVENLEVRKEDLCTGQFIAQYISSYAKPVISAINGLASGAGFEITLASHMRVVGNKTPFHWNGELRLGFPELCIGIFPSWQGISRSLKVFPRNFVNELLLTGDVLPVSRFETYGYFNRVIDVPFGDVNAVLNGALELASSITCKNPGLVKETLKLVENSANIACVAESECAVQKSRMETLQKWFIPIQESPCDFPNYAFPIVSSAGAVINVVTFLPNVTSISAGTFELTLVQPVSNVANVYFGKLDSSILPGAYDLIVTNEEGRQSIASKGLYIQ